jgi:RecA-family ATPase
VKASSEFIALEIAEREQSAPPDDSFESLGELIAPREAHSQTKAAHNARNDESEAERAKAQAEAQAQKINPTPFRWIDPATIPPRQWQYGRQYIRSFVSASIAPGGVGKSSLVISEALAMASGRPLLGVKPAHRCKVWLWNGEDPKEELDRRVMAAALHYGLSPADFEDWLFVDSGRDTEIIIAEQSRDGVRISVPVKERVIERIRTLKIDVLIIDPFISSHRVTENDNPAIDRVVKTWGAIAGATNCAVELVHHARKTNGSEVTVEDGRGAVALLAAARSARVLNVMSDDEAVKAGIDNRRLYFRVDNGKANLAPPTDKCDWHRMASVSIGNGDDVGVATKWNWPDPLEAVSVHDLREVQTKVASGQWRDSSQAKDWIGHALAQVLHLDPTNPRDKAKIAGLLKIWKASGMLRVVEAKDEKGNMRPFVEVGEWASD